MGYNRPTKEMKKSIFILAALFAATFANAQITLLCSFNGYVNISMNGAIGRNSHNPCYGHLEAPYFYESYNDNNIDGLIVTRWRN